MTSVELSLDGKSRSVDATKTFQQVSSELKRELGPDRVITDIVIDGEVLSLDKEFELLRTPVGSLKSIGFKTRSIGDLFKESLVMAPQICEAMVLDCQDLSVFVTNKDYGLVRERISEMMSLTEWLMQVVEGLSRYGEIPFDKLDSSESVMRHSIKQMGEQLEVLIVQLSSEKWEDLSITVLDGWKPEIIKWRTFFNEVSAYWIPRSSERVS